MIAALISAFAGASGLVVDKILLSRERIALRVFLPIVFLFLCGYSLVLFPTLGRVDWEIALLPNSLFLLFLLILVAIAYNVLFYQSVQRESMHEHEMIAMTGPLVTVMLAAVFFPEELDWRIFGLAVLGSVALIVAKMEKAHLKVNATSLNMFLAVVLISTEAILIRELLYSYTPVAIYAIRTVILGIFFTAYYSPRFKQVTAKHYWMMAFSALLGIVAMLGRYYAFSSIGVIHATLITVLAPLIVFLASWEILHERIRARVVVASLVILVAVSWSTVLSLQ